MIDKVTAMETVMRRLEKLPVGHALDLRTYKRNRSVVIARTGEDAFDVVENGFARERFQASAGTMKKLLRTLLKREFPRSAKIRLYDLGPMQADAVIVRKTL
jgi:sarcosine oxidase gamma subunit